MSNVVTASDLRTINLDNKLFKFADDTYLIVLGVNSHSFESEIVIEHVNDWAVKSWSQSVQITAPGICGTKARSHPRPLVRAIERVNSLTMLGVTINYRLSADEHVADTITACSKLLYALRIMRAHGMPTPSLHKVFRATVLAKLLYCNQVWSGFCSADPRERENRLVHET